MEFKQSVKEALAYYVYVLVNPRNNKIFYIGKGKGDRVFKDIIDVMPDAITLQDPVFAYWIKEKY